MWALFTDPLLRGPTLGSMLMAFSAALVGALSYVRGRSLLGEVLSHAAYPGVVIATAFGGFAFSGSFVLLGGLCFSLLALWVIKGLEGRCRVPTDGALTFVLALFFGVGVTLASRVQFIKPAAFKQIQALLYGQAATMTDLHLYLYGGLALLVVLLIFLCYRPLQLAAFDPHFARANGLSLRLIDGFLFFLIALSVILGIRSVGVVLVSAMLIAPPVAARPLVRNLGPLLGFSALFGVISALLGNGLSYAFSSPGFSLPIGPTIVLTSGSIALISLLFAPRKGLVVRMFRIALFSLKCRQEHILKALWKGQACPMGWGMWLHLKYEGWITGGKETVRLTQDGKRRAARIVRLHRLWEVYLADYLGMQPDRVHRSAEEMEHILTPELESRLDQLLDHPKEDPHESPIPGRFTS